MTVAVAEKLAIDWEPGSNKSDLNLSGNGKIKVAILGTETFDPTTIDPTSIRADDEPDVLLDGQDISAIASEFRLKDTNKDGLPDLEITFNKSDLQAVIQTNSESVSASSEIYLFGSSLALEGSFFLGREMSLNSS